MCLLVIIHMSAGAAMEKVALSCDYIEHYTATDFTQWPSSMVIVYDYAMGYGLVTSHV